MKIFEHKVYIHKPCNVNETVKRERGTSIYARFNEKAAVWTTWLFSTMEMFWLMDIFIVVWMVGNSIGVWRFDPMPFALLLFIINIPQLPLLPLLAIKQNVIDRKQSLIADEHFNTTTKIYHDIEQIIQHLNAQDEESLRQSQMIKDILSRIVDKP